MSAGEYEGYGAMTSKREIKTVKNIVVDVNKCNGCKTCEMACSAFHSMPKYSSANPARSRILVEMDELKDVFVPVRAGNYAQAECKGRNSYTIDDKEYSECTFCPASCPSRDSFKEPASGLPLKCDMCGDDPSLPEPICVKVCEPGALTYEEYEIEAEDGARSPRALEIGLESLIKKYGYKRVIDYFGRLKG